MRFLETFLPNPTDVPNGAVIFISKQIGVEDIGSLQSYMERKSTRYEHCLEIQEYYGYSEFNSRSWRFHLIRLLYARAWLSNERPSLMFDFATAWLMRQKVLLPGITTLSGLISEIRDRAAQRLWKKLFRLPDDLQKYKLDAILQVEESCRTSKFDYFRQEPRHASAPSFNAAIERYNELHAFGIHKLNFENIPPVRLKSLARYAAIASMHKIARMPKDDVLPH